MSVDRHREAHARESAWKARDTRYCHRVSLATQPPDRRATVPFTVIKNEARPDRRGSSQKWDGSGLAREPRDGTASQPRGEGSRHATHTRDAVITKIVREQAPTIVQLRHTRSPSVSASTNPVRPAVPPARQAAPRRRGDEGCLNLVVVGVTGAGKSTFINSLAGNGKETATVGHTLRSCTADAQRLRCELDGVRFTLIDTPGFDDSRMSDAEVLTKLVDFFMRGPRIHGLIFLHRITDVRLTGSAVQTAQIIQHICGRAFFDRVALVTSMWDAVHDRASALKREKQLHQHQLFWAPFQTDHANHFQFSSRSPGVAKTVIRSFLDRREELIRDPCDLAIVQQRRGSRSMAETDAGAFLLQGFSRACVQHVNGAEYLERVAREDAKRNSRSKLQTVDDQRSRER